MESEEECQWGMRVCPQCAKHLYFDKCSGVIIFADRECKCGYDLAKLFPSTISILPVFLRLDPENIHPARCN